MPKFLPRARPSTAFLLLAVTMAVGAEGADPLQASSGWGELVLVAGSGGVRLEFPGGHALALALPDRAELSSLAAADGIWWMVGSYPDADGGRRLLVLSGDERQARRLPVPGGQRGRDRRSPVLLVDGGRLAGIAWLEGDGPRSLAVAAAQARDDGRWRRPIWVSRPGPGSQGALDGAVLADGSWLLAWSAFDGQDDEIVWSRRLGQSWLPPARVAADNTVPDITPALAAAGPGALLAWSRYDGATYRLMLARFNGEEWRDQRVAGGPGTLYPSFSGARDRPRLLFYTAVPSSWTAAELSTAGAVVRSFEAPSARSDRPLVTAAGDALRLAWPGGEER